jgi:hypothetical protein
VLELFVGQDAEDIALVLGPVRGAVQLTVPVGVFDHLGIVSGAHGVEAQGNGLFQQGSELDPLVAAHAGVGRTAGCVLVDEVLDDVFLEALGEVPHVVRDAQDVTRAPGVAGILDGAAAAAAGTQGAWHPRQRQVDPDDVMPRLNGAGGGYGGVNSAAHGC